MGLIQNPLKRVTLPLTLDEVPYQHIKLHAILGLCFSSPCCNPKDETNFMLQLSFLEDNIDYTSVLYTQFS